MVLEECPTIQLEQPGSFTNRCQPNSDPRPPASPSTCRRITTHHVDELRELELEPDGHRLRDVDDGPHQLVVVGEEVVVEPLGVGVAPADQPDAEQRRHQGRDTRASHACLEVTGWRATTAS